MGIDWDELGTGIGQGLTEIASFIHGRSVAKYEGLREQLATIMTSLANAEPGSPEFKQAESMLDAVAAHVVDDPEVLSGVTRLKGMAKAGQVAQATYADKPRPMFNPGRGWGVNWSGGGGGVTGYGRGHGGGASGPPPLTGTYQGKTVYPPGGQPISTGGQIQGANPVDFYNQLKARVEDTTGWTNSITMEANLLAQNPDVMAVLSPEQQALLQGDDLNGKMQVLATARAIQNKGLGNQFELNAPSAQALYQQGEDRRMEQVWEQRRYNEGWWHRQQAHQKKQQGTGLKPSDIRYTLDEMDKDITTNQANYNNAMGKVNEILGTSGEIENVLSSNPEQVKVAQLNKRLSGFNSEKDPWAHKTQLQLINDVANATDKELYDLTPKELKALAREQADLIRGDALAQGATEIDTDDVVTYLTDVYTDAQRAGIAKRDLAPINQLLLDATIAQTGLAATKQTKNEEIQLRAIQVYNNRDLGYQMQVNINPGNEDAVARTLLSLDDYDQKIQQKVKEMNEFGDMGPEPQERWVTLNKEVDTLRMKRNTTSEILNALVGHPTASTVLTEGEQEIGERFVPSPPKDAPQRIVREAGSAVEQLRTYLQKNGYNETELQVLKESAVDRNNVAREFEAGHNIEVTDEQIKEALNTLEVQPKQTWLDSIAPAPKPKKGRTR